MATSTTERSRISLGRLFDNGSALAFTSMSALTALGTGLPVVQVMAAGVLPGAFEGIRRIFRTMSGENQEPLKPLMRAYVVGSTALVTPIVNGPSLLQNGLTSLAVAGAAVAGFAYAVNQVTRPRIDFPATGADRQVPDRGEPLIDLSAEPETGPEAPSRSFRVQRELRTETAKSTVAARADDPAPVAPRAAIEWASEPEADWGNGPGR